MDSESELLTVLSLDEKDKYIHKVFLRGRENSFGSDSKVEKSSMYLE